MAAIAFDTLKFARRLKDVGVPEAQAEAQAELMAEAFVLNMDALVTKDYLEQCLDARFARQEARLLAKIDERFAERFQTIDERFAERFQTIDQRFARVDDRFTAQDERFDRIEARLNDHDLQFVEIRGELKLHRWMLALILVTTVLPYLQKLFVLLGG
jgi:DNA repair exonuclease SbcCD ATPase subunit